VEKVIERLGTTESTTLALERKDGGKIRVTSMLWESPEVILKGEVLEVSNVGGSRHIARKVAVPDDWHPPVAPYDPYGPGQPINEDGDVP
jgi:hypothetical protein